MSRIPTNARCLTRFAAIICLIGLAPSSVVMAQFGGPRQSNAARWDRPPRTSSLEYQIDAIDQRVQAPGLNPSQTGSLEYQQIDAFERRIQAARFSLQVVDMPLVQVVQMFTQRTGIPMRIDDRALEDVGLNPETPVTFNLPEVAAETLLYLMLKELDLVYMMDSASVVITTPEEEESNLRTKFYPVEDIFNDPNYNFSFLIEMVVCCIDPESWEELGGPGSIAPLRNGVLVAQTYQNHRRIQGLFAALRRVQNSPRQNDLPIMMSISPHAQQSENVLKRLREVRTNITLANAPLQNAVAAMANFSNLPMMIDNRALEDVGLSTDTPVTMQVDHASIDYMLDILGEKLDLATVVLGEVVIVTTPEEAESELETLVYPVKDLVRYDPATGRQQTKQIVWADFERLIEAITTAVEPESWEELGGPGALAPFPYTDCLVVSQTGDVHRKLAEMLVQVRNAKPKVTFVPQTTTTEQTMTAPPSRSNSVPQPAPVESIIVVSYSPPTERDGEFSREEFARIVERLKQVVSPQSWASEEHFADATHSGIFVRHSRDVQRSVASYLASQGLLGPEIEEEPPVTDLPEPEPMPSGAPPVVAPPQNQFPSNDDSSRNGGGGIF